MVSSCVNFANERIMIQSICKEDLLMNKIRKSEENSMTSNHVMMNGVVCSGLCFSHISYGEQFYEMEIAVRRSSGREDLIPLMISERLVDTSRDLTGRSVSVIGQFRSYNHTDGQNVHLILRVFVQDIKVYGDSEEVLPENFNDQLNSIFLDGYLCRKPVYRVTPRGREIADIMLAVNRPYHNSDYIPCICWGRNARYACGLEVGTHLRMRGRIQSRVYRKYAEDKEKTAYEISVSSYECVS